MELSIEGTNLLGTTTTYQQEIFGDSPQTPGAKPVYMNCCMEPCRSKRTAWRSREVLMHKLPLPYRRVGGTAFSQWGLIRC